MYRAQQLSLLDTIEDDGDSDQDIFSGTELGTFKDSLREPIYRWFKYPVGYSYKFVFECIRLFGIDSNNWIYDPFSGSGTTLIAAKQMGINAYGVEAHSFIHWVAEVKLYWDFNLDELRNRLRDFLESAKVKIDKKLSETDVTDVFPELIYKCYHPQDLDVLFLLREEVENVNDTHYRNFLKMALTDTLRGAAAAGTGWPYISPKKNTGDKPPKDAFAVFEKQVWMMYSDLTKVADTPPSVIKNVLGDSRKRQEYLADGIVDLAVTSPPYLNNYDYADRTRLETYFWDIAETWGDITKQFRDKLITAATTQVTRRDHEVETALNQQIQDVAPEVYDYVQKAVLELSDLRLQKGGRKSYDLMAALYFNDLYRVMLETYRVLKPGGHFCLVLGDSAPYGVHIATDELLGKLGLGIGFRKYNYYLLRQRGGKWKKNPQRHNVSLREGIVVLTK